MTLTAGRSQLCVYRRSGFANVLLHLCPNGSSLNPPGHAEVRWELKDSAQEVEFSTADGICTARLRWDGRCYKGVLLDSIDASLEIYQANCLSPGPWTGTDDEARRELTIITVANSFTPGFVRLWNSCRRWNITPLVLGFGFEFGGLTRKVHLLYRALLELEGVLKTVMFLDGFDTLVAASALDIMRVFRGFGAPLVFSAERCPPAGDRAARYPPAPTPYRFLNSGTFIGEASYILQGLAEWDVLRWPVAGQDQLLLTDAYLADTSVLTVDHECRLFQCMYWAEGDVDFDDNGIRNRITGARPLVVHGNGGSDLSKVVDWFNRVATTTAPC